MNLAWFRRQEAKSEQHKTLALHAMLCLHCAMVEQRVDGAKRCQTGIRLAIRVPIFDSPIRRKPEHPLFSPAIRKIIIDFQRQKT